MYVHARHGEVDARSPIGEAGSQRTHRDINAGMRKTAYSSRKAAAYRPPGIPKKTTITFFSMAG